LVIKNYKMKWIYTLLICNQFYGFMLYSQAIIAPEIGINYHPYHRIDGVANIDTFNTPSIYLGVLGELPLSERLIFQLRAIYVFKQNTSTPGYGVLSEHLKDEYINMAINAHFDLLYSINKNFKIGGGPGIIHKLNSRVNEVWTTEIYSYPINPIVFYTGSLLLEYNKKRLGFVFRYFYVFSNVPKGNTIQGIYSSKSGFTLGINYRLFGVKD